MFQWQILGNTIKGSKASEMLLSFVCRVEDGHQFYPGGPRGLQIVSYGPNSIRDISRRPLGRFSGFQYHNIVVAS